MTITQTDEGIDAVVAQQEQKITELGDPGDVANSYNAMAAFERERSWRIGLVRTIRTAQQTLKQDKPQLARKTESLQFLDDACREKLTEESLALPSHEHGKRHNLTLSLQALDRGPGVFEGTGYCLETSRLGALMREAGFQETPPVDGRLVGSLPWPGSVPQLRAQIKELKARCDDAQIRLERALQEAV